MNQPWVYKCPASEPPSHLPPQPIPLGCPRALALSAVSCIRLGLVIYFTYGNVHISMLFSQIIPPSPPPTETKSLFFITVSLLLSQVQGHHPPLSKFHICVLIYCIGHSSILYWVQVKVSTRTSVYKNQVELLLPCSVHQSLMKWQEGCAWGSGPLHAPAARVGPGDPHCFGQPGGELWQ